MLAFLIILRIELIAPFLCFLILTVASPFIQDHQLPHFQLPHGPGSDPDLDAAPPSVQDLMIGYPSIPEENRAEPPVRPEEFGIDDYKDKYIAHLSSICMCVQMSIRIFSS